MNHVSLFFLILSIFLNSTCAEKNNNKALISSEDLRSSVGDTLKFTGAIRSILQDSKGNYWFGSDQEGVCKYDGKTFTYYSTESGFCGKQVINIQEDESGLIWFGTSSGLCSFDGEKFTSIDHKNAFLTKVLPSNQYANWQTKTTDLWFPGNIPQELIRIDNGKIFTIKYPYKIPTYGIPVDLGITGFSKSKNGGLWVAHYSGVNYYDGKNIQYINDSTMAYDGKSNYMHVRSILEDKKGRLWIGNNGIGVLIKEKDSILNFSKKNGLVKGNIYAYTALPETLMHVFVIKEDTKGNIWFGDRDTGAWRFDGKELKNFILDSTLNTQQIWEIYEDNSGNLLFASGVRGVYKFNGKGFDRVF